MNGRYEVSLASLQIKSMQSRLELYSETISVLQAANEKLTKENQSLKQQLERSKMSSVPTHKVSASLAEPKSNLMDIIENFQNRSVEISGLESLQQEFEDVEELQNTIKQENQMIKQKLRNFLELGPLVLKIESLAEKVFFAFQSVKKGEDFNVQIFLSSDKKGRNLDKLEFFSESLIRSKELLEKIVEAILDYVAEKVGNEGCKVV